MENLNNRLTITQHFLESLRIFKKQLHLKKPKINDNITNQMVYALKDVSVYYPKDYLKTFVDEVLTTNKEI
jgi:hypothetical protein